MGRELARTLNQLIEQRDIPRADVVAALGRAAGIDPNTVNQILNGSIDCPPEERLRGFARELDVSFDRLRDAAGEDGCQYGAREMVSLLKISEFRGDFPSVPLFNGIDRESLVQGDDDPMFVTLPVAEVDAISGNGRYYDAAFVSNLLEQIRKKRPVGQQGHISDSERATAFPTPAAYWVGAIQEGKTLWGKAYIPQQSPMREVIRKLKAVGGQIATSIYGLASQTWDAARGAYAVSEFELESIDFAPAERAGVSSLARIPLVTAEINGQDQKPEEKEPMSEDRLKIIREMTAEDVDIVPQVVKEKIAAAALEAAPAVKLVKEMRGVFELDDNADLLTVVKELRTQIKEAAKAALVNAIDTEVKAVVMPDAQETDRVKGVRATVTELVKAAAPDSPDKVKDVVKEVTEREHIKLQIEDVVAKEMGPKHGRHATKIISKDGERFIEIPEEEAAS